MRRSPRSSPSPTRESLRRVLIRDAFYRQGPFLGSGGHYSPGPTTDSPLLAMGRPLNGTLAPPWVLVRTSPHFGETGRTATYLSLASPVDGFTHRRSLRARSPFTRPCRSFWSAYAELIRDQTPPDDFCNCTSTCGQPNPGSHVLAGTEASTSFLFLRTTPLSRAVMRGETRDVRFADPGAGSSRLREFAQPRCLQERPTTGGFTRGCIVRIDAHVSKDRAKDASRGACDDVSCLRPVPTHNSRKPTAFPSSATFGHPLSPARAFTAEEAAANETSRPRPSFRRRPAKSAAIRKTGMSSAATTREGNERGEIAPSGLRAGSLAHAAHTFSPGWGECFEGHCECHGAVTRDP